LPNQLQPTEHPALFAGSPPSPLAALVLVGLFDRFLPARLRDGMKPYLCVRVPRFKRPKSREQKYEPRKGLARQSRNRRKRKNFTAETL
jgi:hypothetical protein